MNMDQKNLSLEYLRVFSNFFNRKYILNYINKKDPLIKKSIYESEDNTSLYSNFKDDTYANFFDYIYDEMKKNYRCEYVYLNEILINEILKKHNKDHSVLTEVNVGNSQVDLLVVNGTTTAYEIKTELDSLARLETQLYDYVKVFDRVYVITYKEMVPKLKSFLDQLSIGVGIYVLNEDGQLDLIRKSRSHIKEIDKESVFNILNSNEYAEFGEDYALAKHSFLKISKTKAHEFLRESLRNRSFDIDIVSKMPNSLKMAYYKLQSKINKKQNSKLISRIYKKIREDF